MDLIDTIEGPLAIKRGLSALANITLTIQSESPESLLDVFDQDDLVNATLILNSVMFPLAFRHHQQSLRPGGLEGLAAEIGTNLRQLLTLATGIDVAEAVAQEAK